MKNLSEISSSSNFWIYIIIGLIAIGLFLIIFFSVLNSMKNSRVCKNSQYIAKIRSINQNYDFEYISNSYEARTFHLNTKRQFDDFNFWKRRQEFVKDNLSYFEQLVDKISFNIERLSQYKKELSQVHVTNDEKIAKESKMSLKSFYKRELKLGAKIILHPTTSYNLRLYWEYTSPAGRNHYSYYRDSSFNEIKSIVEQYTYSKKYGLSSQFTERTQHIKPKITIEVTKKVYTSDDIEEVE